MNATTTLSQSVDRGIIRLVYALAAALFFIFSLTVISIIISEKNEEKLHTKIKHYHMETIRSSLTSNDEIHKLDKWFYDYEKKSKISPYLGLHPENRINSTLEVLKINAENISRLQAKFNMAEFGIIVDSITSLTQEAVKKFSGPIDSWGRSNEAIHDKNIHTHINETLTPLLARYHQLKKLHETVLKETQANSGILESGKTLSTSLVILLLFITGFFILFLATKRIRITLKKQSELFDALRSSDEQITLLMNFTSEAIYGVDLHGHCTFANEACAHILGYEEPNELVGTDIHALIHNTHSNNQNHSANECKIYQACKNGIYDHADDEIFWKKNGESFYAEYWSNPIIKDNQIIGSVVNFFDISDKIRNINELSKKQDTLDKAQEIAHIGSWDWNISTDELNWSDEIYRIFGLEPNAFEATYTAFLGTIHPEDKQSVIDAVETSVNEVDVKYDLEHRIIRPDGSVRLVHEEGIVYRDAELNPYRMIGTVLDVTERKAAENELKAYREHLETLVSERTRKLEETQDELVRSERLATLGKLTATVSHELRNPLGAMRPSLYIIKNKKAGADDAQVQQAIDRVDRNITRCDHIIDELLDFTRSTKTNFQPIILDNWINQLLDEQTIPDKITVRRSLNTGQSTISFDSEKMRRAVINILENAFHASTTEFENRNKDGMVVSISTHIVNNQTEITVTDTGPGIPDDVLPKIFEPLFSTKGFGVGLGMAIVKQIIELHEGDILVDTRAGKGTSVTLRFPLKINKGAAA